ncbi:spore germination protein [Guptibacillus algicola]|uniref:spore germination protein n=1 Tax=Guptibacillus algicola TaxID=225844 RepID=UPI001CD40D83|nr:spore germination protein [Alkalihalobacillus algicola]MCA0987415.1 spore germination protein [Alkalihalobacillus algicola]
MKIRKRSNKQTTVTEQIIEDFHNSSDVQFKSLALPSLDITLVFICDITNKKTIQDLIIAPLLALVNQDEPVNPSSIPSILPVEAIDVVNNREKVNTYLMDGYSIIIASGKAEIVYAINTSKFVKRNTEEPVNEPTISGPRDGFVESIEDNKALIRKHMHSSDLVFERYSVGTEVKTCIELVYLKGKAREELLNEARERIDAIEAEYIGDAGLLEQTISKNKYSTFPELTNTQFPLKVTNALMEGKITILTDGSPTALIAPTTLNMLLQTPDDYYFKWIPASLTRILTYFAAIISFVLPAIYISLISFHHGLIPTDLAISLSKTREGVPFPSVIEAFLMELTIEILREAGIRLPKPIGSTVSIVGAIVIGETAVSAGIVSPMMVMVISFTAICSFTVPNYQLSLALRSIRFFLLFFAAILGIYGMLIALFIISTHLVSLRSFKVPYMEPFAPFRLNQLKDSVIRLFFKQDKKAGKTHE